MGSDVQMSVQGQRTLPYFLSTTLLLKHTLHLRTCQIWSISSLVCVLHLGCDSLAYSLQQKILSFVLSNLIMCGFRIVSYLPSIQHGCQLCGQGFEMLIGFHGKVHNYSVNF